MVYLNIRLTFLYFSVIIQGCYSIYFIKEVNDYYKSYNFILTILALFHKSEKGSDIMRTTKSEDFLKSVFDSISKVIEYSLKDVSIN